MPYSRINIPPDGENIIYQNGSIKIPDRPLIPFIEGDGTGPDIWRTTVRVLDAAVEKAYGSTRKIAWMEIFAGEKAFNLYGEWLPKETIDALREFRVGIKGPLTTPVGGGFRSINVAIRKALDLYVCMRPVRYIYGVPSPVRCPQDVDMVIFRENTEDIYTGAELELGTDINKRFMSWFQEYCPEEYKKIRFPQSSGISIKPISRDGTERLVRAALKWALDNNRRSITLVHKGNIMKYTEGAFRNWGYELAEREFDKQVYTYTQWERTKNTLGEAAANNEQQSALDAGKLLVRDAIADIAFQQTLTRAREFDIIATMNLNGDYLSDALAAQVGGIGMAPGGNINYDCGYAVFEATHGTAPKYANHDKVNPCSLILSGEMMFRYIGWDKAADNILRGIEGAVAAKTVTYDLHRLMQGATLLKCSEFGDAIVQHMD
jgi:isocitrate dehydrogenase